MILTSKQHAEHPFAGQNTQHQTNHMFQHFQEKDRRGQKINRKTDR